MKLILELTRGMIAVPYFKSIFFLLLTASCKESSKTEVAPQRVSKVHFVAPPKSPPNLDLLRVFNVNVYPGSNGLQLTFSADGRSDFVIWRACLKTATDCMRGESGVTPVYLGQISPGEYQVNVRACIYDSSGSIDENLCGITEYLDWTSPPGKPDGKQKVRDILLSRETELKNQGVELHKILGDFKQDLDICRQLGIAKSANEGKAANEIAIQLENLLNLGALYTAEALAWLRLDDSDPVLAKTLGPDLIEEAGEDGFMDPEILAGLSLSQGGLGNFYKQYQGYFLTKGNFLGNREEIQAAIVGSSGFSGGLGLSGMNKVSIEEYKKLNERERAALFAGVLVEGRLGLSGENNEKYAAGEQLRSIFALSSEQGFSRKCLAYRKLQLQLNVHKQHIEFLKEEIQKQAQILGFVGQ